MASPDLVSQATSVAACRWRKGAIGVQETELGEGALPASQPTGTEVGDTPWLGSDVNGTLNLMGWTTPAPGIECHRVIVMQTNHMRGSSTCRLARIGLDLAKNVFQIHGVDASRQGRGHAAAAARAGDRVLQQLPPCLVGMEACAHGSLLGARTDEARPYGAADAGELREGLRQAVARTMRPMPPPSARR